MPISEQERVKYLEFLLDIVTELKCRGVDPKLLLWHYTSGNGLLGIVGSGTIYATQVACLNDGSEVLYGRHLLRDALIDIKTRGVTSKDEDQLIDLVVSEAQIAGPPINSFYVACFSHKKDDLSQWRGYCGGENGYAIAFLADGFYENKHGSYLVRVNYDADDHRRWAAKIATTTLKFYSEGIESRSGDERERWKKDFIEIWSRMTLQIALYIKDAAFNAENEYRIVHEVVGQELKDIRFTQKESLMAIHFPLAFPPLNADCGSKFLPIQEVMIGPSRHKYISQKTVEVLMRQNGYDNVRVSVSNIPFQKT